MFHRIAFERLDQWAVDISRKPLIIRGARQVGKTTLVEQFARKYDQYLYLNLELPLDRKPFEEFTTIDQLLQAVFFLQNKRYNLQLKNLLFN